MKNYYANNRKKMIKSNNRWRDKNKDKVESYKKKWAENNMDKIREKNRRYKKNNPDKIRRYNKKLNVRIVHNLRNCLNRVLKMNSKSERTMELVGCSIKELKQHLKKQFTLGMDWNNYGIHGWHIDHIKSCCTFDLSKEEEQKKCFHYSNLQPLWAKDNFRKKRKNAHMP